MKPVNTIIKILTALAAVAGTVYIIATYGEKIVEWAKKVWAAMPKCSCCQDAEPVVEEAAAEEVTEEAVAEEVSEEPVAEEVVVEETEPVAEEADFAE